MPTTFGSLILLPSSPNAMIYAEYIVNLLLILNSLNIENCNAIEN